MRQELLEYEYLPPYECFIPLEAQTSHGGGSMVQLGSRPPIV